MDGAANATDLGLARGGGILRDVRGIGLGALLDSWEIVPAYWLSCGPSRMAFF